MDVLKSRLLRSILFYLQHFILYLDDDIQHMKIIKTVHETIQFLINGLSKHLLTHRELLLKHNIQKLLDSDLLFHQKYSDDLCTIEYTFQFIFPGIDLLLDQLEIINQYLSISKQQFRLYFR